MEDNKNMTEHFENCPFCGKTPAINFNDLRIDRDRDRSIIWCSWEIRCMQCGIRKTEPAQYILRRTGNFEAIKDGRAEVIKEWNKRA